MEKVVIRSTPWTFLLKLFPALLLVPVVWSTATADPGDRSNLDVLFAAVGGLVILYGLYRTGAWLLGPQLTRYEVQPYALVATTLWGSTSLEWQTIDSVVFVWSRLNWRSADSVRKGSFRLRVRASGVWHDLPSLLVLGDERQLRAWTVISTACERHRVELRTENEM